MSVEFVDEDLRGLQALPAPPVVGEDDDVDNSDEYDNVPRTRFALSL